MFSRLLIPAALFALLTLGLHVFYSPESIKSQEEEFEKIPLQDRMDLAIEQENELTRDPSTGTVPRERLLQALAYTQSLREEMRQERMSAPIPGINWTERGPSNVGGRTRAILVDPNDPSGKSIFAAGVGGGIWKTTDITAADPVWTPINDFFSNIAVSCIAADPSNPATLYFGTGEGYYNGDAIRGLGVWKSTDAGLTWNQLASTNSANFYYVQRVAIQPGTGNIFVATRSGLFKSSNGGSTFTKVLGAGTGASSDRMADLEIAADGSVWVAAGISATDGVYKAAANGTNTGNAGSWTKMNTGGNGFPTAGFQRIEIACAPSDAGVVYAVAEDAGSGDVFNIYKTSNGGVSWTTVTMPVDADGGVTPSFSRNQAWYDLACAVDPNNSSTVYVGGVDLFKSTNGGSSWQQISHWYGGFGFQDVHADQHTIVFQPGNSSVIYFGNDGGVFRTTNGTAAIPTIISKNNSYNVTQFYACAAHPAAGSNYFLAGAQDNGSHRFNTTGINATVRVTGGDGCFTHIDQDQPQYQWTSYVYNNYYRSTNGGNSWTSVSFGNTGSFVNPCDYDNTSNVLYAAVSSGNFLRWTNPQSGSTTANVNITSFGTGNITHVAVSDNTPNRVFFGLSNGRIVRVDNANTIASGSAGILLGTLASGSVSSIVIENGNDNHLLVTYSNYGVTSVWESTNALSASPSFTNVEGNLPDMPVRWALFNPNNNQQALLATEIGVWSTDLLNGTATNWSPSNSGLANTRVDMLQLRTSDNLVVAATHGRGLFTSDAFMAPNADFAASPLVAYTNQPVQFTDGSSRPTAWNWDFGDGQSASSKNPLHAFAAPGLYTVTLTINNNNAYKKTRTAYVQVLPDRNTPYTVPGGAAGSFDINPIEFGAETISGTPFERGNSAIAGKNGTFSGSSAWVTGLTASTYADNSNANLYCPNYNLQAAGTYVLSFYAKWAFENSWDGFRVEYSLNKGASWTPLGTAGAGWYNYANTTGGRPFPTNQAFFSGTVSSYTKYSLDISFLSGNANVAFRFVFKSDSNTNAAGLALDNFEITGPPPSALPVELLSFSGESNENYNLLRWSTASETNNSGFELQRSTDGTEFKLLSFLPGFGTTSAQQNYSFKDSDRPADILYYRLKQIDYDGAFNYSEIVALRYSSKQALDIRFVLQDPDASSLKIRLNKYFTGKLQAGLWNVDGKLVYTETVFLNRSNQIILAGGTRLAAGIYFLRLEDEEHSLLRKVVVQ